MLPKFFVLRLTGKLQNLSAFNCLFYMQYIIAAGTIFIFALYCIKFCFEQKECSGGGQATTPPPLPLAPVATPSFYVYIIYSERVYINGLYVKLSTQSVIGSYCKLIFTESTETRAF